MDYTKRLYMILYPHNALVASQLTPDDFAKHYTAGSSRHYQGKVIFAEIDPTYRHDFFRIEEVLDEVKPHKDGRPKATKFVASYRVLEHIAFGAIIRLHLATQEGYSIGIGAEKIVIIRKTHALIPFPVIQVFFPDHDLAPGAFFDFS